MYTRPTKNQAEAFAILKALEYVQTDLEHDVDQVTTVYTDSRTTLESLHNMNKHTFLTEEIRRKVQERGSRGWTTRFRWIKAHMGTTGNELADKLAKEVSSKTEIPISYNRIPKCAIERELEENSNVTWQKEWKTTKKGSTTKEYSPTVAERLETKINFTQNLTTIVTGLGNRKSYLHRFRIIEAPDCPCANGNQTVGHIIRMRNSTRRKGTPNSGSGGDGRLIHKKRYAHQKALQTFARLHKNGGKIR